MLHIPMLFIDKLHELSNAPFREEQRSLFVTG